MAVLQPKGFPETRPSLLAALRDREGGGWGEFYQHYGPAVFRVARMRGLDVHDAEDVVQQVMMAISGHIAGFHYQRDRGRFRQWVRRIAEHKIIDLTRRQRPTDATSAGAGLLDPPDECRTASDAWEDAWEQEWKLQNILYCIEQCRCDIAPRTYEAFRLYVVEGVSARETAARVGMSIEQVYVVRYQVVSRVRDMMSKLDLLPSVDDAREPPER
jgi:RNA polymerase sigma factor (sigma-70 family)